MAHTRPTKLDPPVDVSRDHVLGSPEAEMTLVEYGSYACPHCHAVHIESDFLANTLGRVDGVIAKQ